MQAEGSACKLMSIPTADVSELHCAQVALLLAMDLMLYIWRQVRRWLACIC